MYRFTVFPRGQHVEGDANELIDDHLFLVLQGEVLCDAAEYPSRVEWTLRTKDRAVRSTLEAQSAEEAMGTWDVIHGCLEQLSAWGMCARLELRLNGVLDPVRQSVQGLGCYDELVDMEDALRALEPAVC